MKTETPYAEAYLQKLIRTGENQHLDFKFEISDARKIARTFSAFANTDGGKLLIGVKDNGRISGVRTDEEMYMAEAAARMYCKPAVDFTIRRWEVGGRWVLEIDIQGSQKRPHFARNDAGKWTAYVRVHDQNLQANRILIRFWQQAGKSRGVMLNYRREEKILLDYLIGEDKITFSRFVKIARTSRQEAEKILVDLMLLNIITTEVTEKTTYYRLRGQPDPLER